MFRNRHDTSPISSLGGAALQGVTYILNHNKASVSSFFASSCVAPNLRIILLRDCEACSNALLERVYPFEEKRHFQYIKPKNIVIPSSLARSGNDCSSRTFRQTTVTTTQSLYTFRAGESFNLPLHLRNRLPTVLTSSDIRHGPTGDGCDLQPQPVDARLGRQYTTYHRIDTKSEGRWSKAQGRTRA